MALETIVYEKKDRIAYITLHRPERLNAINGQMMQELLEVCEQIGEDDEVGVVIITGAGERAFSVGADVSRFREARAEAAAPAPLVESRQRWLHANPYQALAEVSKPTIAAINGYALGGGLELALACDMRIASEKARLGLPEVKLGLIPGGGGTQRLPRLVGRAKALEMILTGDPIDAQEALRIGLVSRVVPPELLGAAAEDLARALLSRGPIALRYAKEALNKGLDMALDQGLRLEADLSVILQTTEDRKEGIRAFMEKRPPRFQGR